MEEFAKILTYKWKEIIESINVGGYSREVLSVNLFRMNKYYTGYPEIKFCYKCNFYFGLDPLENSPNSQPEIVSWQKELEEKLINIFLDPSSEHTPYWTPSLYDIIFKNSKVDYMSIQGNRIIVQFYPQGFLSEFREEKLKSLGI